VIRASVRLGADLPWTIPEMQIPPGSARLSSRAATFDPITINLIALDNHVAEVDPDAKFHPALRR
jgi:hypothetical protein